MLNSENRKFYDFGAFRLDVANRLLQRGNEPVRLTLKEFELLLFLIENAGEVVSKDALLDGIWKGIYIEEGTLTRNISRLRKKLETASENGDRFIDTLPKRGYRFLAPVVCREVPLPVTLVVEEKTLTQIRVEETLSLPDVAAEAERKPRTKKEEIEGEFLTAKSNSILPRQTDQQKTLFSSVFLILIFATLTCAAFAFAVYQSYFRRNEPKAILARSVMPFSSAPGRENTPSFSPDGKQIVYAWNGGEGRQTDIYVRLLNAGEPVRLTDTETSEQHPTYSPDGLHIAFVRDLKTHGEVVFIPALGGAERRVCKLFSGFASVSFAPDGKTLAVIDTENSTAGKQYAVYLVDIESGERRRLTAPAEFVGETTPRFSLDGESLAFVRVFGDKTQDLFVVSTSGGEPRQITFDRKVIHSLAWSADNEKIFFVSLRGGDQTNVWSVAATGGEPELFSVGGRNITNLAVSRDGKTVAFVENSQNSDIWQTTANQTEAKRFAASMHNELAPNFSPDNKRIVFVSNRTGKNEIWSAEASGGNLRQLTNSEFNVVSPRFSPDGSQIVYHARANENTDIFVIPAEGGAARRLTDAAAEDELPVWSADGHWIYFASNRMGEMNVWKMPATGGEPTQITRVGGYQSAAAPDGKAIFFTKKDRPEMWQASVNGDETEKILPEFSAANFIKGRWTANNKGIYFLADAANQSARIKFYNFADGKISDFTRDNKFFDKTYDELIVSHDGTNFLFVLQDRDASNIMLAEIGK